MLTNTITTASSGALGAATVTLTPPAHGVGRGKGGVRIAYIDHSSYGVGAIGANAWVEYSYRLDNGSAAQPFHRVPAPASTGYHERLALGGGMELPNKNVRVFITAQFKNAVGNIVNLTGTHGLSVVWSPC